MCCSSLTFLAYAIYNVYNNINNNNNNNNNNNRFKISLYQTLKLKMYLLTLTALWVNSADDPLIFFFLLFPENRIWHFMQIVSFFWRHFTWNIKSCFAGNNKKNIWKCLQIFSPRALSVNITCTNWLWIQYLNKDKYSIVYQCPLSDTEQKRHVHTCIVIIRSYGFVLLSTTDMGMEYNCRQDN